MSAGETVWVVTIGQEDYPCYHEVLGVFESLDAARDHYDLPWEEDDGSWSVWSQSMWLEPVVVERSPRALPPLPRGRPDP